MVKLLSKNGKNPKQKDRKNEKLKKINRISRTQNTICIEKWSPRISSGTITKDEINNEQQHNSGKIENKIIICGCGKMKGQKKRKEAKTRTNDVKL